LSGGCVGRPLRVLLRDIPKQYSSPVAHQASTVVLTDGEKSA
jgi:hypothetical protein